MRALLTPQGKIIADFFVVAAPDSEGGFYLDCPAELAAELAAEAHLLPAARQGDDREQRSCRAGGLGRRWQRPHAASLYRDPRLPGLGLRVLVAPEAAKEAAAELGATLVDESEYDAHRIALGVPRGGLDFLYGDAFPHDADLDKLNGVDFKKGCFIGQEVVSRVEHRGTARNRIVPVSVRRSCARRPATPVMAGDKAVGTMGSSAGKIGLAMLRVDRVAEALAAGATLSAGGIPLRLREGFTDFIERNEARLRNESDQACRRTASLPVAEGRPALCFLSRQRMGRAGI